MLCIGAVGIDVMIVVEKVELLLRATTRVTHACWCVQTKRLILVVCSLCNLGPANRVRMVGKIG